MYHPCTSSEPGTLPRSRRCCTALVLRHRLGLCSVATASNRSMPIHRSSGHFEPAYSPMMEPLQESRALNSIKLMLPSPHVLPALRRLKIRLVAPVSAIASCRMRVAENSVQRRTERAPLKKQKLPIPLFRAEVAVSHLTSARAILPTTASTSAVRDPPSSCRQFPSATHRHDPGRASTSASRGRFAPR